MGTRNQKELDDADFFAVIDDIVFTDDSQYRFHCPCCEKLIVVDKLKVRCPKCGAKLDFREAYKSRLHSADHNIGVGSGTADLNMGRFEPSHRAHGDLEK